MVALIQHEEDGLVGGQRQALWVLELAGLIALRSDGALPLALYLTSGKTNSNLQNKERKKERRKDRRKEKRKKESKKARGIQMSRNTSYMNT
jgi:hypothetical protein